MVDNQENILNNIYKTYNELKNEVQVDYIKDIPDIIESLRKSETNNERELPLNQLQEVVNKVYGKYGVTDNIILLQAGLNRLRHYYDIPDPLELITYPDGEFVQ